MTASDCLAQLPAALHAVAPHVDAAIWSAALLLPMQRSGLVTPRRAAIFLGQCAEESGGFTVLVENLNYSARRLMQVWPSRFPDIVAAAPYAQRPEVLANHVYANRLGNGDEASGDGWACRGVGPIQLTGRDMQERFAFSVSMTREDAFAWAQTPPGAAASACWYWLNRGQLLTLSDAWDIQSVTQRINGGLTNLATRVALCDAALRVLEPVSVAPPHTPTPPPAEGGVVSSEPTADDLMSQELAGRTFPTEQA